MSDPTVTVAEIAAAMGRRPAEVEREAAELGMLVKPDWAGRPSLSVADARVWHPVRPGATSNSTAAEQRDTKACVEGRTRAMYDAARRVRATAGSRGPASVSLKARDVARSRTAVRKRTPRPSFGGIHSVHLEYVESRTRPVGWHRAGMAARTGHRAGHKLLQQRAGHANRHLGRLPGRAAPCAQTLHRLVPAPLA
jgi:hypothetical protein